MISFAVGMIIFAMGDLSVSLVAALVKLLTWSCVRKYFLKRNEAQSTCAQSTNKEVH